MREKAEEQKERSISSISALNTNKSGKKVLHRQVFATGGLDQDLAKWGGESGGISRSKAMKKDAQSTKDFTEFDPNKPLRTGGKIGNKAFKSTSKHKRR